LIKLALDMDHGRRLRPPHVCGKPGTLDYPADV
jgi:hypothetical protein